jgi:hypothetical protein
MAVRYQLVGRVIIHAQGGRRTGKMPLSMLWGPQVARGRMLGMMA